MADNASLVSFFDILNPARLRSPTLEKIWQDSFGTDYAKVARPNGFYTQEVLNRIESTVRENLVSGVILDAGCGNGLAGIALAKALIYSLHGIDISPESIRVASENAAAANLTEYNFAVADIGSTGLDSQSCAAIICLDVLLYVPDKAAALKELGQLLALGGILAFTSYEQSGYNERLKADQVPDYRPLIEGANLEVLEYDEVPNSKQEQLSMCDGLIANEDKLIEEIGGQATTMLVNMARSAKEEAAQRRYVYAIARAKPLR